MRVYFKRFQQPDCIQTDDACLSSLASQGRGEGEGPPPQLKRRLSLTSILSLLRKGEATHQRSALVLRLAARAALVAQMIFEQLAGEC